MGWSYEVDEVAVLYEIKKAADLGLSVADLLDATRNGEMCDALELFSATKIRK